MFIPFSWTPDINQTDITPAILKFNRVLNITLLPRLILINILDIYVDLVRSVRNKPCVATYTRIVLEY
jgi:hypothetical protein